MNGKIQQSVKVRSRKTGFALIDLLIAIAVGAIFVACALPAIQEMREAARSTQCDSKLAQIGLKSQVYEVMHGRLPCHLGARGAIKWDDWISSGSEHFYGTKQSTSPLGLIARLDGLDRLDPVLFDFDTYDIGAFFNTFRNWTAVFESSRPEYLCPSVSNNQKQARPVYAMQPTYLNDPVAEDFLGPLTGNEPIEFGFTNFVGCLGASSGGAQRASSDLWTYRGMITCRETVTSQEVANSDGLSNTFMFGESIGESVDGEITTRQSWLCGGVVRGRAAIPWMTQGTPETQLAGRTMASSYFGFGSTHRNGVRFVLGDASTRIVSRDIDWQAFYELCGAFDTD